MACGLLCQLMDKCGLAFEKISGVAFCVSGLVDSASGILKMHPGYNWVNKDIAGDVSSLTGYRGPVSVENNACARSTSAQMFQRGAGGGGSHFPGFGTVHIRIQRARGGGQKT